MAFFPQNRGGNVSRKSITIIKYINQFCNGFSQLANLLSFYMYIGLCSYFTVFCIPSLFYIFCFVSCSLFFLFSLHLSFDSFQFIVSCRHASIIYVTPLKLKPFIDISYQKLMVFLYDIVNTILNINVYTMLQSRIYAFNGIHGTKT